MAAPDDIFADIPGILRSATRALYPEAHMGVIDGRPSASRRDSLILSIALEGLEVIARGTAVAVSSRDDTRAFAKAVLDRIADLSTGGNTASVKPVGAPPPVSSRVVPDGGRNRDAHRDDIALDTQIYGSVGDIGEAEGR